MNMVIAETGYVGVYNAVLPVRHKYPAAAHVQPECVKTLQYGRSPVSCSEIDRYLAEKESDLTATTEG